MDTGEPGKEDAVIVDEWKSCYPSSWKGIITPESFSHPAKVSSKLAERIYQHAIAEGWLHEGSRVVDPFGGIGGFAFHAILNGMDMTLVELEPKFVTLAQANIDAWNAKYRGRLPHFGTARIIQGDSRHLAQVIGAAEACISSPPFMQTSGGHNVTATEGVLADAALIARHSGGNRASNAYGYTEGQLGNLPPGNVEAVISSPPYAEGLGHGMTKTRQIDIDKGLLSLAQSNYGSTPGQLASLPRGAPPFDGCVSSPPYEASLHTPDEGDNKTRERYPDWHGSGAAGYQRQYSASIENLGNDSGETFWSAAREIVAQVYQVLAPGAHAIWVTKRYIKDKKIVEFTEQWIALCESIGFKTLHIHRAMLVKHNGTQYKTDGSKEERRVESKSFFAVSRRKMVLRELIGKMSLVCKNDV